MKLHGVHRHDARDDIKRPKIETVKPQSVQRARELTDVVDVVAPFEHLGPRVAQGMAEKEIEIVDEENEEDIADEAEETWGEIRDLAARVSDVQELRNSERGGSNNLLFLVPSATPSANRLPRGLKNTWRNIYQERKQIEG